MMYDNVVRELGTVSDALRVKIPLFHQSVPTLLSAN